MIFSATLRCDRLGLLGHVHGAHAPFADLLQEFVGANLRANALFDTWREGKRQFGGIEKRSHALMLFEQRDDFTAQNLVAGALGVNISLSLLRRRNLKCVQKNVLRLIFGDIHGVSGRRRCLPVI